MEEQIRKYIFWYIFVEKLEQMSTSIEYVCNTKQTN
jgi:hypothetical protein